MSQNTENIEPIGNYMRILSPSANSSFNGIMNRSNYHVQKQQRLHQLHTEEINLNLPTIPIVTLGGVSAGQSNAKRSISLVQSANYNDKSTRKNDNKSSSMKSKNEKVQTIRYLINNKSKKPGGSNKIKQTNPDIKTAKRDSESELNFPAKLEPLDSHQISESNKRNGSTKSSDTENANMNTINSGMFDLNLKREESLRSRNKSKKLPNVNNTSFKQELTVENASTTKIANTNTKETSAKKNSTEIIMATQPAEPIVLDSTILSMKSSRFNATTIATTIKAIENKISETDESPNSLSNRSLSNSPSSSSSASNLRSISSSNANHSAKTRSAHSQKSSTVTSKDDCLRSLKYFNLSSQEDKTSEKKNAKIKQQSRPVFDLNDTGLESKLLLEAKPKSISSLHLNESTSGKLKSKDSEGKGAITLNKMNFLNTENASNDSFLSVNTVPKRRVSENDLRTKEEKEKLFKQLELLHTVGTGTFGRVMLVRNSLNKQYYALKIMSIVEIIRLKQADHVRNEKNVLESVNSHPFIVRLYWTHHNEQHLYMLLEYIAGGELFSLLRQRAKFEAKAAVFYAAEIVCALEYLHSLQIVYRDLKPENILLGMPNEII
jgi:hypothetical protein